MPSPPWISLLFGQ